MLVKSRKTGGDGVYHTKTHLTFDDDNEEGAAKRKGDDADDSDEEYQAIPTITPYEDEEAVPKLNPATSSMSDLEYLKSRATFKDEDGDDGLDASESRTRSIRKRPSAVEEDDSSSDDDDDDDDDEAPAAPAPAGPTKSKVYRPDNADSDEDEGEDQHPDEVCIAVPFSCFWILIFSALCADKHAPGFAQGRQ